MTRSAHDASLQTASILAHESVLAGIITAQGKQGQAIAQLSDDIREAIAQQNDKIRELIALCQDVAERVDRLEALRQAVA